MKRKSDRPGFKITDGRGFQVTFENGWGISVQFGWGHYCANKTISTFDEHGTPLDSRKLNAELGEKGCINAEIAILTPDNTLYYVDEWGDSVKGYVTPDELLPLMIAVQHGPRMPGVCDDVYQKSRAWIRNCFRRVT